MDRKDRQQRPNGSPTNNRPLSARPMAGAFKGVRIGPTCLKCQRTIDARQGLSLSNPRGARGAQRQGYLHEDCLREDSDARKKRGELTMLVPVLDEEEIVEILKSKGIEQ